MYRNIECCIVPSTFKQNIIPVTLHLIYSRRQAYNKNQNSYQNDVRSPSPMSNNEEYSKSDDIAEMISQVKKEQLDKSLNEDENMEDSVEGKDPSELKMKSENEDVVDDEKMNTSNEMDSAHDDDHNQDSPSKKTNINGSYHSDDALILDADDDLLI